MYKAFKMNGNELNMEIDNSLIEDYKNLGKIEFENAKSRINSNLEAFKDNRLVCSAISSIVLIIPTTCCEEV